jgi:hypothetical protein
VDRERVAPASAFAGAPVADHGVMPASPANGVPGGVGDGPGGPNGRSRGAYGATGRRSALTGGPPPGFEPVPAPPGLGGNGNGTGPGRLLADGRVMGDPAANSIPPGSGIPSANGISSAIDGWGNSGEYSFWQFPDEGESSLRPIPGDADHTPLVADPFPRAGRLPDGPQFPVAAQFPDVPQFSDAPQLPDTVQFPVVPQLPDASSLSSGSAFTDQDRLADDTDQFPPTPQGDPH